MRKSIAIFDEQLNAAQVAEESYNFLLGGPVGSAIIMMMAFPCGTFSSNVTGFGMNRVVQCIKSIAPIPLFKLGDET